MCRYLARGCTRYFCSPSGSGDSSISKDRKSESHLSQGPLRDALVDDVGDFRTVCNDLKNLGMTEGELNDVFTTIASVLHLGNISFEDDPDDNRGGCRVQDASEGSLAKTAQLMGLDQDELRRALTARVMQVRRTDQR